MKPSIAVQLLLAIALACAVRLPRLGEPVGGFHSFNEANYPLEAQNFRHGSFLVPTIDGAFPFIESPPFFSYLLFAASLLFGQSLLIARCVAVASSLLLAVLTALLARQRFGKRAGWAAAVLMSVAPVAAITGRNIQTDSLYLALVIGAMLVWPREDAWTSRDAVRTGSLLGLALFTKLFAGVAVIALGCYELIRMIRARRQGRRFDIRQRALALVIAGAIPFFFYGYHFVRDRAFFVQHVLGGAAAATTFPQSLAELRWLLSEAWWAYSPLVSLALIAGLIVALMKRTDNDFFFLLPLTAYAVFYLHTHKHSYYMLSLLPFAAILAARAIALLPWRTLRFAVIAAIASHATFVSLVDLASMKLGYRAFADLGSWANRLPRDATIILDRDAADNAYPIVLYYLPGKRVRFASSLPVQPDGFLQIPANSVLIRFIADNNQTPAGAAQFSNDRYALSLGRWRVIENHPNPHYFRQDGLEFEKTARFELGFTPLETYPAVEAFALAGHRVLRASDGSLSVD